MARLDCHPATALAGRQHRHAVHAVQAVPHTHLELVQHHVPQALVVDYTHVDVDREGLPSHAADHHLHASQSVGRQHQLGGQRQLERGGSWKGGSTALRKRMRASAAEACGAPAPLAGKHV